MKIKTIISIEKGEALKGEEGDKEREGDGRGEINGEGGEERDGRGRGHHKQFLG